MQTSSVLRTSDNHINTDAYQTAAKNYYVCYVVDNTGKFTPCLLTEADVNKGVERAIKNPEDVLPVSLILWVYHKIKSLF